MEEELKKKDKKDEKPELKKEKESQCKCDVVKKKRLSKEMIN